MTGKTHRVIGITAGLAWYLSQASLVYGPATLAAVIGTGYIGALLPDIDQSAGLIWRLIPGRRIASQVVNPFLQHRNLTHSLLGIGLIGWGAWILFHHFPAYWGIDTSVVTAVFLIAYASHILADSITVEGVPLLFPYPAMLGFPPHPFQGVRILTDHWFENLIIFPAVNLILLILIWSNWPLLHRVLFR